MEKLATYDYDLIRNENDTWPDLQNGLPSRHHTPLMQKLCEPLKDQYKINYINYTRYYEDGIAITSSDDDYTLYKLLHNKSSFLHEDAHPTVKIEWVDFDHPDLTDALLKRFSYLNGLSIIMKHDPFIEHISLGTSYLNTGIIKDLQKDQSLLNSILFYFRDAASEIISDADNYKIAMPKNKIIETKNTAPEHTNLIIDTKKFNVVGYNGECILTHMEITCLIETLKLKTSKQIASSLGISPKTVEHHLAKLKVKLGIKSKNQLYIIARNNALI